MALKRIAVLGAGIAGVSTALFLAKRGVAVTLYEAEERPFSGASRWNEGKIHLGFLYSGDGSLRTAERLIPGGLVFRPLVEELIGGSLDGAPTTADDIYLCHRDGVTPAEAMETYFGAVAARVREHRDAPRYITDVSDCAVQRLTPSQLSTLTDAPEIVAGFRIPERSVSTTWIADRFIAALAAETRIETRMGACVTAAQPTNTGDIESRWLVRTAQGEAETFDIVVNTLWAGRLAVDVTAGLAPQGAWSHRYRLSVFLRASAPVSAPSITIATGPFGDVKAYGERDFYLSWYPDGLRIDSADVTPPSPAALNAPERESLTKAILDHLEPFAPAVSELRASSGQALLEGGWVFAAGGGRLADPRSPLHRRADFGVTRRGRYISVDTGKYSTAPWLAHHLAESLCS